MKQLILIAIMLSTNLYSAPFPIDTKQFPEQHEYHNGVDRGFAQYYTRSLFKSRVVSLTYDDGPDPITTPKILDVLKKYNVKAVFFTLGEKLGDPKVQPVIKRIIQEGHFLSSHDWTHRNNNRETKEQFKDGLKKSILAIEKLYEKYAPGTYHPEMYFRFPFGAYGSASNFHHFNAMKEVSQEIYGENCINFAFWDIDTVDWLGDMNGHHVFQNIVANIEGGQGFVHKKRRWSNKYKKVKIKIKNPVGGGIILMHDVHAKNIKSTELFLEYASTHGIDVVPLNEVKEYSYAGKTCEVIAPL